MNRKAPTRSRVRRAARIVTITIGLGAAVAAGTAVATVNNAAAGPRPAFQLPFPCGQQVRMESFGHAPALDMFRAGAQTEGNLLVASADGVVNKSQFASGAGNLIQINHGRGWFTTQIHLQSRAVQAGDRVVRGQPIGRVGHTGETSHGVPHVHYEQAIDRNGDGQAEWGRPNPERVPPVFNRVEYGKRNGQSATVASANCGGSGRTGPVSDTNGDGKGDVLVTGTTGGVAGLWRFGGAGSGTLYAPRSVVENSAFLVGAKVAVTDVNGDGRADAVLARGNAANQTELFVWAGNTDGTLVPEWTRDGLLGVPLETVELAAGDTQGDGNGDVLISGRAANGTGGLWRFGGADSGTLYSPRAVFEDSPFFAGAKVAVTDVNGDGRADAVLARGNAANQTELFVWAGNTDGTLAPQWTRDGLLGVSLDTVQLAAGDTEGDGRGDVLITSRARNGAGGLWRFGGAGSGTLYSPRAVVENSAFLAGAKVAVTDVNGDGRADAVLARRNDANQTELLIWAGNTDGTLAPRWSRDGLLGVPVNAADIN